MREVKDEEKVELVASDGSISITSSSVLSGNKIPWHDFSFCLTFPLSLHQLVIQGILPVKIFNLFNTQTVKKKTAGYRLTKVFEAPEKDRNDWYRRIPN